MAVDRYRPHIFVLPEDDADLRLANGFHLQIDFSRQRQMQVLPVAGGWRNVLDLFKSDHIPEMEHNRHRHMILLIDFDGHPDRLEYAKECVPNHLMDRVFVLGVLTEPEDFSDAGLGSLETIGQALAQDCRENTNVTWGHDLLRHNATEIDRLRERVRPILFE